MVWSIPLVRLGQLPCCVPSQWVMGTQGLAHSWCMDEGGVGGSLGAVEHSSVVGKTQSSPKALWGLLWGRLTPPQPDPRHGPLTDWGVLHQHGSPHFALGTKPSLL